MTGETPPPTQDHPEESSEASLHTDLEGRVTSPYEDAEPAETTDPSLFSIRADTRPEINIWQLKWAVVIALPFGLFLRVGDLWNGIAGGVLVGLVAGLLVTGVMLSIRYYRGR